MTDTLDEEIHAISENYAGIVSFLNDEDLEENFSIVEDKIEEFSRKYARYLLNFDKEKVIEILIGYIKTNLSGYTTGHDHQFIYRPSWVSKSVKSKSTFCLKFKRCANDDLKFEYEYDK